MITTRLTALRAHASDAGGIRLRLVDSKRIRDEDLTQNPSQGSINWQIFPLIRERFLSELPEPPL
jgi:hypothetical protein